MKKPILKNSDQFWGLLGSVSLFALIMLIMIVIEINKGIWEDILTIFVIVSCLPILICISAFIICPKFFISKVFINECGIAWLLYKKQIKFIKWEEINFIYPGNRYRMRVILFDLLNSSGNPDLDFYIKISKKRLKLFIELCPIPELKEQFQKIKISFWGITVKN